MRSTGKASQCIPFFYFEQQPNSPQRHKVHKGFSLCPLYLCGVKIFFEQVSLEIN